MSWKAAIAVSVVVVLAIAAFVLWGVIDSYRPGVLNCEMPDDGRSFTPVCS